MRYYTGVINKLDKVLFLSISFKKVSYGINIFFRELAGPITFCQIFIIEVAGGSNS